MTTEDKVAMNFSEIFIRRPIATSLLMLAIALFGVVSYRALPVADLPTVDFPTLSVSASLPGADPATMASAVATPLERQFTGISGLDSMTSVSSLGSTSISLQFDLNRNIDGAAVDVVTAINAGTPLLPPGMPSPPSFHKSNPSDIPIVFMGVTSATLPMWVLDDYAETLVAPANLHHQRRGAGERIGSAKIFRPRAGGSEQAVGAPDRHQRGRAGPAGLERQYPHRHAVRAAPVLQHPVQRAIDERRRLPAADGGLAKRQACAPRRNRQL